MKLFALLLVGVLIAGTFAVEDIVPAAKDKSNSTVTETNDDPPPKRNICNTCNCNAKTRTIDCEDAKLFKIFTEQDWIELNSTGAPMDEIRLGSNELPKVTKFPNIPVKILDLSNNEIASIEKQAFIELQSMEELDLSYNKLTSEALSAEVFEGKYDPNEYEPLKSMKKLNLGHNLIHVLKQELFEHFPQLEILILESNPFKVIDLGTEIAISGIFTLKALDLSYMELETLPVNILHGPTRLESLNLTGNLLTKLPETLKYAVNLKFLSLDENPIEDISGDNCFPVLDKMEVLLLSYMSHLINIGNGGLSGLQNLKELHVCNNPHLKFIHSNALSRRDKDDPTREDWPLLKGLYLHNNNLSYLDSHLLSRWDQLEVIDIRANPWMCDCDNQWLIGTLIPDIVATKPGMTENLKCAAPKQMAGKQLLDLNQKHSVMRCLDRFNNNPERDGPILMGLLIGLLVGIPFTLAMVLIYKRGCLGFCGRPGPADYSRAFYKRATTHDDMNI